jgi:glucokinase
MYMNDEAAKQVVEQYIEYVAIGVTNIVNIFQPDVICIGGGIANEGDNLLEPVKAYVASECYTKHAKKQTKICKAVLGNDAGIIGAALAE